MFFLAKYFLVPQISRFSAFLLSKQLFYFDFSLHCQHNFIKLISFKVSLKSVNLLNEVIVMKIIGLEIIALLIILIKLLTMLFYINFKSLSLVMMCKNTKFDFYNFYIFRKIIDVLM